LQSTASHTGAARDTGLAAVGILVVAVIYLLQIFSPMRLIDDGVVYLSLATSAVDGHGFVYHGSPERYPPGYPALIYLLVKSGLGYSWAFNGLNLLFLALGFTASYHTLRGWMDLTGGRALLLCCMSMLSFILIKHAVLMVSDPVFFGASVSCLWALLWAERAESIGLRCLRLAAAVALCVFATSVRVIGIALLPSILFVALGGAPALKRWGTMLRQKQGDFAVAAMGAVLLGIVATVAITGSRYFHMAAANYQARGLSRSVVKAVEFQVGEWGEFVMNVPQAKLPAPLRPAILLAGIIALAMVGSVVWRRRQDAGPIELYLIAYLIILLAAPWQDARYLLPVVPLLLGYLALFDETFLRGTAVRFVPLAYFVWFSVLGVAALAYSTRITFSGASFPDIYGDGTMRATYREAYGESAGTGSSQVNPEALELLLRYEPRFRR
jgi:hypothetical protein